jgi:hypothetical protein
MDYTVKRATRERYVAGLCSSLRLQKILPYLPSLNPRAEGKMVGISRNINKAGIDGIDIQKMISISCVGDFQAHQSKALSTVHPRTSPPETKDVCTTL